MLICSFLILIFRKMDAVDDFFNEINEIAPPKKPKHIEPWQECFDKHSGFTYYWNVNTDEVTWNRPTKYVPMKDRKELRKDFKKPNIGVPPKAPVSKMPSTEVFPSTSINPNQVKIYSIQENLKKETTKVASPPSKVTVKSNVKKPYRRDSSSEDEKIELITSYGSDSESDQEADNSDLNNKNASNNPQQKSMKTEDSEADLLTKLKKKAQELRALDNEPSKSKPTTPKKEIVSGISLIAGYSDSEEESEGNKDVFPENKPESPKESHSTLFPIAKPVDINSFIEPKNEEKPSSPSESPSFDSKAFQRKRRIGVSLVNTKRVKESAESPKEVSNKPPVFNKENLYAGFTKGGVMFTKSEDTEAPVESTKECTVENKPDEMAVEKKQVEGLYSSLKEKLTFLCEGRSEVPPIQVMSIQADILFVAMNDDHLKPAYLRKWLSDTVSELVKLEKEAAPEGWLLQWDRSHKRYYYRNEATGDGQWEFPQPDVTVTDDNMDISTTPPPPPPPPDDDDEAAAGGRPAPCGTPPPPPPPIISGPQNAPVADVPLPPLPPPEPAAKFAHNGEPLPPGVDLPEMMSYNAVEKKDEPKVNDSLSTALDSFYSEIAATTETAELNSQVASPAVQEQQDLALTPEVVKKKKKKVKLAPGLTMKKKGVSQLVEKWKNVQKTYND